MLPPNSSSEPSAYRRLPHSCSVSPQKPVQMEVKKRSKDYGHHGAVDDTQGAATSLIATNNSGFLFARAPLVDQNDVDI